jgi:hypothetical protein
LGKSKPILSQKQSLVLFFTGVGQTHNTSFFLPSQNQFVASEMDPVDTLRIPHYPPLALHYYFKYLSFDPPEFFFRYIYPILETKHFSNEEERERFVKELFEGIASLKPFECYLGSSKAAQRKKLVLDKRPENVDDFKAQFKAQFLPKDLPSEEEQVIYVNWGEKEYYELDNNFSKALPFKNRP